MRVASEPPTTATNKILKRELIRQGVGAAPEGGNIWWERVENGNAYSELAGAVV